LKGRTRDPLLDRDCTLSLNRWHGSPVHRGGLNRTRNSGMVLRLNSLDGRELLKIELSVEQLGRLMAGEDAEAYIDAARMPMTLPERG